MKTSEKVVKIDALLQEAAKIAKNLPCLAKTGQENCSNSRDVERKCGHCQLRFNIRDVAHLAGIVKDEDYASKPAKSSP